MKVSEYINFLNSVEGKIQSGITDLSILFQDMNMDDMDLFYIPVRYKLSEEIIDKYGDMFNWWNNISHYQELSEIFIIKHSDKLNWNLISMYQKLSEQFIEEHSYLVNWYWISFKQELSEPFIEKYRDRVNWSYISERQKLSNGFIEKYYKRLNINYVTKFQNLSEEFLEKYYWIFDWDLVSKYQCNNLSENFIDKFSNYLNISVVLENSKGRRFSLKFRFKYSKLNPKNIINSIKLLLSDKS